MSIKHHSLGTEAFFSGFTNNRIPFTVSPSPLVFGPRPGPGSGSGFLLFHAQSLIFFCSD